MKFAHGNENKIKQVGISSRPDVVESDNTVMVNQKPRHSKKQDVVGDGRSNRAAFPPCDLDNQSAVVESERKNVDPGK